MLPDDLRHPARVFHLRVVAEARKLFGAKAERSALPAAHQRIAFTAQNANRAPRRLEQLREGWHDDAEDGHLRATDWVLVARDAATLQRPGIAGATRPITPLPGLRAWTDDFNNLFSVLK